MALIQCPGCGREIKGKYASQTFRNERLFSCCLADREEYQPAGVDIRRSHL